MVVLATRLATGVGAARSLNPIYTQVVSYAVICCQSLLKCRRDVLPPSWVAMPE